MSIHGLPAPEGEPAVVGLPVAEPERYVTAIGGETSYKDRRAAQRAKWELAHMIEAHHLDPITVLQRCTGERWAPIERRAV